MEGKGLEIVITPEHLFSVVGIPVTNTVIATLAASAVLIISSFFIWRKIGSSPKGVQNLLEFIIESVMGVMEEILGDRKVAQRVFPFIMTVFLFVLTANWMEFLPGVGSIRFSEGDHSVPFLRSVNTDLNVTVALAIVAVVLVQVMGFTVVGLRHYGGKFINLKSPIGFFIGLIELMSEATRLVSFSFRLFGNIFAGEVLLMVMGYFLPVLLPVPFMLFEVMVGFIQATIFAGLMLIFVKVATTPHEEAH